MLQQRPQPSVEMKAAQKVRHIYRQRMRNYAILGKESDWLFKKKNGYWSSLIANFAVIIINSVLPDGKAFQRLEFIRRRLQFQFGVLELYFSWQQQRSCDVNFPRNYIRDLNLQIVCNEFIMSNSWPQALLKFLPHCYDNIFIVWGRNIESLFWLIENQ